jgi:HK97 family phage prohead protease
MRDKNVEMRFAEIDGIQIRAEGEGETKQEYVDGLGIVYNKEVEIFDGYFEKIRSGAFDKCLKRGGEIKSFFNHNPDYVLATTRSSPALVLEDTPDGLIFHAPIPNTSYGRDLTENLSRRNVRGASFAFTINKNGVIWSEDEKGNYHREIIDATIFEVGPVTNPAYPQTKVKIRSEELAAEAREYLTPAQLDMFAGAPPAVETEIAAPEARAESEAPAAPELEEAKAPDLTNENLLSLRKKKLTLMERSLT